MQSIGFDNASTGILLGVMILGSFVFEIPSGILADKWSRKGVNFVALVALLIATTGGGLSQNIVQYNFFLFIWGVYKAMISGTKEAIIYDLLLEVESSSDNYKKYYSRHEIIQGIGFATSSLASTAIVYFADLRMAYHLTSVSVVIALVAILFLKEPLEHKKKPAKKTLPHLRSTFAEVFHQPSLYLLIASSILVAVVIRILFGFAQLWWIPLGASVLLFGVFNALLESSSWIAGVVASRIQSTAAAIVCACIIGLSALLTVRSLPVVVVAIVLVQAGMFILTIFLSKKLNDNLSSEVRAGSASIIGFAANFFSILFLVSFGYISERYTISNASWIIVALAVAIAIGAILIMKKDIAGIQKIIDLVSIAEIERVKNLLRDKSFAPARSRIQNFYKSIVA